ncbi:MAG: hypothetical protein ACLSU6_01995 [Thomasclavelia ramosa]
MDDVIQRLVEIDRKCVERVEAAKAKKLDAQTNMNEKEKRYMMVLSPNKTKRLRRIKLN